ncbi:flippase [Clostridium lundense]|uniref:flippase n=1 Tax=Clostridium lundense TaxID=319475 RepID=UPI0006863F23|nr:flippase [Clostridium lundense]
MKVKSIKYNAILNIIYNITNIIFPLITFPYVSRILLTDGTGKVSFFTSIATYATMFASLGISTYGIRATAKVRDNKKELSKLVQELLGINLISTISVLAILIFSAFFVDKFQEEPILFFINCIIVTTAGIGLNWLYSGLEEYEYITKRSIVFKLISLVMVFAFVHERQDYIIYAAITAFSTIGSYICNFYYAHRIISFKLCDDLEFKKHFRPMVYLFASILAVSMYTNLDTVMLGFINGDTEVGLYTVAVKAKWLLLTTVNAISTVLLPRLSYYINEEKFDEFNRILKKSISTIIIIAIPLTFYFIIEAKDTILILGGLGYLNAVKCMQIIMPILLISGFSNITGNQILIPLGKDNCFMVAVVIGAVIDFILNLLLMPRYGCIGAAVATLMAEITQMIIQSWYARKYILHNINYKTIIKTIIATAIAVVFTLVLNNYLNVNALLSLIILGVAFFTTYGTILFILREPLVYEYIGRPSPGIGTTPEDVNKIEKEI